MHKTSTMKKVYILGLAACTLAACKPNLITKAPSKGSADFTTYLAVGNSLTAGYADNSLYLTGQQNSYPLRLSEQFALVGGGSFKQPLLTSDVGFPSPKLVLAEVTGCNGVTSLSAVPFTGPADNADYTNISAQGPFNNIGVPGIRCIDYLYAGYAGIAAFGGAPYAARFYDDPADETPLQYLDTAILKLNPTFFTCWIGNNDVLLYATGGGQGDNDLNTNVSGFLPPGNISPLNLFEAEYDTIVKTLVKNGAKGALINIPDVTSIPLFNTIPVNGLTLRAGQADTLNAYYAAQNISTSFTAGANYFVIQDHDGNVRQAKSGEYILLTTPQDSITCYGWGSTVAIPSEYVLTYDEVANIEAATTAYNNVISAAANTYGLAYVDMNAYLKTFVSGIMFNGVTYNATYVTGGAFSLDGVHLTPRGYAIVANHIIDVVNSKYGATVPDIDVNKYNGLKFP
jgi:lysophospholipase L1-like esterase